MPNKPMSNVEHYLFAEMSSWKMEVVEVLKEEDGSASE